MPLKTLSNGTLSLKFMQRRAAASGTASSDGPVELLQAKVADEAEWDVGQAVRDAWGMGPGSAGPSSSSAAHVVYEASYLPFLHSSCEEDDEGENEHSIPTYRSGRWNNLPLEQTKQTAQKGDEEEDDGHLSDSTSVSSSSKADPKGKAAGKRARVDSEARPASKKRKATAAQAHHFIKDTLESIASMPVKPPPSTTLPTAYPVFLRPSGVDAPRPSRPKTSSSPNPDDLSLPKKKKTKKKKKTVPEPTAPLRLA
ncbi:hypothetical protein FRB97_002038 [Tulasnella sp. 331]|nr:hypothetical protein FRB97_002038 [Tulasnella sp. 331]